MSALGYVTSTSIFVIICSIVWYLKMSRYFQLGNMIPGPPGLPILGNMLTAMSRRNNILEYFRELRHRYGLVCKGWLGPHLLVGLSDPRDVAVILNSSQTLSKAPIYNPIRLVFGKSLILADTEVWNKFRKIMNPTFTHQIIDTYVKTFYEKSLVMADRLEKHSDESPFDMVDFTMPCTLEMVSETSLGVPVNIQKENPQHCVVMNFPRLSKIVTYLMTHPWFWFTLITKFSPLYQEIIKLVKPIRDFVDVTVKQKTYSYLNSRSTSEVHKVSQQCVNDTKQRLGFLEQMISTMVNNPGLFTAEKLRDQAMFVMAAATDTSAYTVAYTLMLLGSHQDIQEKVMREQEDIFGEDMDRPVTAEDLKQMVYLEQVINETMRLYPIIPFVARWVDEDVRISDYTLPAGTTVLISIYLVHRQPAYYPDPDKFDPDRFSEENRLSRPSSSFVPFVSGRRMCIGRYYAYMAMKTMLSVVLRRYKVLKHGSRQDMDYLQYNFLLKMVNGHNVKLRQRTRERR
ncbi:hypothetical protein PR048_016953 [Dryococelus australis]|uniref:Cytochrome P450 n=1 Tax=Dryococelus australis TaxID=614101 RepID=A0ABQ9H868_9NEOP|nr:hypothetical protein PR048_016953 [Dryococelus australis]